MFTKNIHFLLLLIIIFTTRFAFSDTRIDTLDGVMAKVHNRFQIFGTCYANAAVDLFDSYRFNKKRDSFKREFGSSLLVSIITSLDKYKKKDVKFLLDWPSNYPETTNKRPFDGGRICKALNTINKFGIYSYDSIEKRIFSILKIKNNGSKEDEKKLEFFLLEELRLIYLNKDVTGLIKIFPDLSLPFAISCLKGNSYLDFLSQLFMNIGKKIPFKGRKLYCREQKIFDENRSNIKDFILQRLSSKKMSPLAINYYSYPLNDNYIQIPGQKQGAHVASIVGKKVNRSGKIEILIKNTSYTPVISKNLKHIDKFHFWIELDLLLKYARRISYFEK